jgi:hypothetical protein
MGEDWVFIAEPEFIETPLPLLILILAFVAGFWRKYHHYVSISIQKNGTWTRMPDSPFATGLEGDQALRNAMAFLTERLAA